MESKFKKIWEELLKTKNLPSKLTGVKEINYKDFKLLRDKFDLKKSEKLIQELHEGKVLIIKNAFDRDLVDYIKNKSCNSGKITQIHILKWLKIVLIFTELLLQTLQKIIQLVL